MRLTESKLQAKGTAYVKSQKHEAKCIQLLYSIIAFVEYKSQRMRPESKVGRLGHRGQSLCATIKRNWTLQRAYGEH